MINLMFAMGKNGEFGRSLDLHKSIVAQSTDEELRKLPKNGLPWVCRPDMLFFRTMTNGIISETGLHAYNELRNYFGPEQLAGLVRDAADYDYNVVMVGRKTWQQMSLPDSETRVLLPICKDVFEENDFTSIADACDNCNDNMADVWIVGGKEIIMSALQEHAEGKLHIDNMYISTILNPGPSDILLDWEKITAYIDSNFFIYNEEIASHKEVLIQRFRGNNK